MLSDFFTSMGFLLGGVRVGHERGPLGYPIQSYSPRVDVNSLVLWFC